MYENFKTYLSGSTWCFCIYFM
ncbi:KxYKxGKxW signal peptide domain-containing protein [Leeuwenhoekiella sp. W20_SRS_FM14]